jgi:hypothetical protein
MLRSPEGKQRADQWFAGYRHGAAAARDGGYRELGRVHSALVGFAGGSQYSAYPLPLDGTEAYGVDEPGPDGESLPEPLNAAPALTPPVENGETTNQERESEPPAQAAPLDAPGFSEPPFEDDPEPPASENDDQPLSMQSPVSEQQAALPENTVGGETQAERAAVDMFDVKPAAFLKVIDEDVQRLDAIARTKSPASTMRFVDESPTVSEPANLVDANSADRRVIRNSFRGWSRRVTAASTFHYRTPQAQEQ